MGDSLAVEHRTLTPIALVRIQVPQPTKPLGFHEATHSAYHPKVFLSGLHPLRGELFIQLNRWGF